MLDIYKTFAPNVLAILEKAEESQLKVFQLLDMEQMPSFIHEKLAVIGDAAHPFLPYQGQGGGQAMEDGAALAAVLPLGTPAADVTERLQIFERCRYERAHKVQQYTRIAGMSTAELAAKGMKLDQIEYVSELIRASLDRCSSRYSTRGRCNPPLRPQVVVVLFCAALR